MGVVYIVIGFDMEVQPLVTHNAAIRIKIECSKNKCRECYWHSCRERYTGHERVLSGHMKYCRIACGIIR